MYHKVVSVQQWQLTKDRRKVTTPTTAQRKMGFDNLAAQATANDFNFDLPRGANGEPLPNSLKLDTVDMGQVIQERQELEVSKAELAQQNARIAKIKADMLEGKLVDKALAFNRVYSLGLRKPRTRSFRPMPFSPRRSSGSSPRFSPQTDSRRKRCARYAPRSITISAK